MNISSVCESAQCGVSQSVLAKSKNQGGNKKVEVKFELWQMLDDKKLEKLMEGKNSLGMVAAQRARGQEWPQDW